MSGQHTSPPSEARGCETQAGRYLTFVLSGQEYGVGILSVREIVALQEVTPMPGVPSYVEGVINLRGRIIPIIDLGQRLALEATERTSRTCIVVTETPGAAGEVLLAGCIVDMVSEVAQITSAQIEPPPQLGADVDLGSILGLAKVGDSEKVVSLLDIDRVLGVLSSLAVA